MRERETLLLAICLMFAVLSPPFFLAAFFLGAPTRRIHKPRFVWHIDRWGGGEAGHEGADQGEGKGAEIREESGPIYIGMQKP